jgi:peroxiredoxin
MEPILIVSSILLWIVVLFNLLLTVALIRRSAAQQPGFDMENVPTLEIGSQAPDFAAITLDGEIVTSADFENQPVVLIFISPTCQPCLDKLLEFHASASYAKTKGMAVALVSVGEEEKTKEIIKEHNIAMPILIAPRNNNPFMKDYEVAGTPFYCVIDIHNRIQRIGFIKENWLSHFIQECI